jgi:hypothetical protein
MYPSSGEEMKALLCWVHYKELTSITSSEYQTMGKAQKLSKPACYTASSEPSEQTASSEARNKLVPD